MLRQTSAREYGTGLRKVPAFAVPAMPGRILMSSGCSVIFETPWIDLGHHPALLHLVADAECPIDLLGRPGPSRESTALKSPHVADLDGL